MLEGSTGAGIEIGLVVGMLSSGPEYAPK